MSEVNVLMAGRSNTIEVSYEQLSTGKFVRTDNDLSISTQNLSGETETVLLKDYFLTSPDLFHCPDIFHCFF